MTYPSAPTYPFDAQIDQDARLARELYQQEQDARVARDLEVQIQREEELQSSRKIQQHDAVVAQKLEQELRDEDVARQLALAEEQALQQRQQQQAAVVRPSRTRRLCTTIVPCLLVGALVGALLYFLRSNDGSGGTGINIPFLRDTDPFDGLEPGEVARWNNRGASGLQLTMVNALDQDWHALFQTVISDWDNGTPDCLDLSTQVVTPDPGCDPDFGTVKVCNGNYGQTDWKGINVAAIQNGYIRASSSRVNEYYLSGAATSQRRYTLCHEIGHSFGLPHTDEDFYNRDLGNCMDYTDDPEANQQPDESNFKFLEELYGALPNNSNRNRGLREAATSTSMPEQVRLALQQAVQQSGPPKNNNNNRWRMLHSSPYGQAHSLELDNGWSIRIHKSMAE